MKNRASMHDKDTCKLQDTSTKFVVRCHKRMLECKKKGELISRKHLLSSPLFYFLT